MVTSAADLGDLCSWSWWPLIVTSNGGNPNNLYLPLHDIPFWKRQTKDIAMVTSSADLGDLQTKPNQIMHIYPYMICLFGNAWSRTMKWWALQLIWLISKPNNAYLPLHIIPYTFWRSLFEFSLSLPLDLRISTNPLKVSQIIEGGTSWVGRKYCQKFGRFKMITSLTFFR